jgi:Mrp family chromosome partitioning ATPase
LCSKLAQPTFHPELFVLTKGPTPPDKHGQLVYSPTLVPLLRQLKKAFDVILIDTPPLLQVADARLFSRIADGAVMVVRARHTSVEALAAARRPLAADDSRVLGLVLNDWDMQSSLRSHYGDQSTQKQQERTLVS